MPTTVELLSLEAREAAQALIEARDKGKIGASFEAEITKDDMVETYGTSALTGLNRKAVEELHNRGHIAISNHHVTDTGARKFTVRLTPLLSSAPPPAPDLAALARKFRI